MKTSQVLTTALCALLVWCGPAWSEWQTFGDYDGLDLGDVHSIIEDSSGDLWFAAFGGGVYRYDGLKWTTYTTENGLASNRVVCVFEDSSGDFWFGTRRFGVSHFDGHNWTTYAGPDIFVTDSVREIMEDSSGNLWFGSYDYNNLQSGSVSRYDGVSWVKYTSADGLAPGWVTAIIEDSSGDMWFGTWGGASRYDGVNWVTYTTADGLASDNVLAIIEDSSGDLWFGTYGGGVTRYDGSDWVTYTTADGLADDTVNEIIEDRSGALWFATDNAGVSTYDGVRWTTYGPADGLCHYEIYEVFQDSSGNFWFGTEGDVSRYDGSSWKVYLRDREMWQDEVASLFEDSRGDLWVGTYGGVLRYDGSGWTAYTTAEGLAHNSVYAIAEDVSGNIWLGTGSGVSRYDGANWTAQPQADGLDSNWVTVIIKDSSGDLWFGTYGAGVTHYDGLHWETYTEDDGLAGNLVISMYQDSSGDFWFGTEDPRSSYRGALSHFDGANWTTYKEMDGQTGDKVLAMCEDSEGHMWFGTMYGALRYDGSVWTPYTLVDDPTQTFDEVSAIGRDRSGQLWFGTWLDGVMRFDGSNWITYTEADGLGSGQITALIQDSSGQMWFGHSWGLTAHRTDGVAPHAVVWPKPPSLSSATTQTLAFAAAFGETRGITFSHSLDESPWSDWSEQDWWTVTDLTDGKHEFRVRARDRVLNVDSTATICAFETDATPPEPVITSPIFRQAVRDSIEIEGTANDLRFKSYMIEARAAESEIWEVLTDSAAPVQEGILGSWNTASLPDGDYELRLSVEDSLGLTGRNRVVVVVDNEAPWAYETTPALIKAVAGGDVYTTRREAHLYFPPSGFLQDTEVRIERLNESDVPDTLTGGATRAVAGYEISWGDSLLAKPATLEMSYEGMEFQRDSGPGAYPDENTLAVYKMVSDTEWRRLGGTIDSETKMISASLTEPGRYSVFTGGQVIGGGRTLSPLSITPRVFSPSGGFAASQAAIGFTLGRPGPVTVKVYNRAGRLVSEVISGEQLNAGANLVHWDGRDRVGDLVEDGVYMVTVEALGQKQVKPLAVVR